MLCIDSSRLSRMYTHTDNVSAAELRSVLVL